MARSNYRFWSSRRYGVGIFAAVGAVALVGCNQGSARDKTDPSQVVAEQEESRIGQTHEALTFNTLVWEDQFTTFKATVNKPASPYSSHEWYIQQHFKANGESQDYLNVVCDTASQTGSTGTVVDGTNWVFCIRNEGEDGKALQVRAKNVGGTVRSGRLNSKRFAEFQPTASEPIKMSARIKMPSGAHGGGFWPAVWFLQNKINEAPVMGDGDTAGWPCIGAHEIDLFEHGSNSSTFGTAWGPNYNKSSMHGRESGCVAQQSPITIGVEKYTSQDLGDNAYHVWAVELETKKARFYYDGAQYGGELDTTGRQFDTNPWFWIINVAAGGSLGGGYNSGNFNGDNKSIYVDYVRVEKASSTPTARNNWGTFEGFANSIKLEAETNDGMLGMTAEATTDTGGGQDMGFIDPSDWVEWYVNFATTQDYNVVTRNAVNNPGGNAQYRLVIDGTQMATVPIPNTGGWQTWASNYTNSITIPAGKHYVRFLADTAKQNLNWLILKPATAASCTDEVKNGTETGVDCGNAACGPCPTCNNGQQDVDAIPNPNPNNAVSTNGSRSQNWNETGIDCGGPCSACNTSGPGSGAGANLEAEMGTLSGVTANYTDVATLQLEGTGVSYNADTGTNCATAAGVCHENSNTTIGGLDANDWIKIAGVNMNNVSRVLLRFASANAGGKIGIRIDSATGTKIGEYTAVATGGWTTWADRTVNLTAAVAGTHDLYLKGESGSGIGNLDYIKTQQGSVNSLDSGDYVKFTQVDMTSVAGTQMNFLTGGTGTVGIRYGSATGTQIGTIVNPVAGNQQVDFSPKPTGKQDLFIKFETAVTGAALDDITLVTSSNTTGQGVAGPVTIANPSFDLALTPTGTVSGWFNEITNGGTFTSNSSWGRVSLPVAGTDYWMSQQYQSFVAEQATYVFHCDYKGNEGATNKTVQLFCERDGRDGGGYDPYGSVTCNQSVGGAWVTNCSVTCTPTAGVSFKVGIRGGMDAVDYDFDSCTLVKQ